MWKSCGLGLTKHITNHHTAYVELDLSNVIPTRCRILISDMLLLVLLLLKKLGWFVLCATVGNRNHFFGVFERILRTFAQNVPNYSFQGYSFVFEFWSRTHRFPSYFEFRNYAWSICVQQLTNLTRYWCFQKTQIFTKSNYTFHRHPFVFEVWSRTNVSPELHLLKKLFKKGQPKLDFWVNETNVVDHHSANEVFSNVIPTRSRTLNADMLLLEILRFRKIVLFILCATVGKGNSFRCFWSTLLKTDHFLAARQLCVHLDTWISERLTDTVAWYASHEKYLETQNWILTLASASKGRAELVVIVPFHLGSGKKRKWWMDRRSFGPTTVSVDWM